MKTPQPRWIRIAQLGDVDPITYGGYFVYRDRTNAYAPEAEVLIEPADDEQKEGWTLYRFILDRCTYIDGVLSDNPHHPDHAVWFADYLTTIAVSAGRTRDEMIADFTDADPIRRAHAYQDIGHAFGWHDIYQYPRIYSKRSDLPRRIRRYRDDSRRQQSRGQVQTETTAAPTP